MNMPSKTECAKPSTLALATLWICLLLGSGLVTRAASPSPATPNFVIIFIDDLGYGDIGPFGATKQKTPNLDRMAKEGMKLTSFYAAPVCSVSRAQLLTGCYGARVSVPGVYGPGGRNGLNPAEFTIAERLKERGYATACIGKWHVGDQPEFLPTRQGFDRYFGIPYSNDMQRKAGGGGTVVPLLRDDKVLELLTDEQQSRIVERYTDEALSFIREKKGTPFLLYLPHTAVHTPIHPGARFAGKSANGRFGDWVEEVDWSVGRVLETLRELHLDQSTLVIFTSDNGPWAIKGPDGGSSGPLRGSKGSTWEGGVRVPTIAWWPGRIAPGSVCDAVAGTIDLLPTAVALTGAALPAQPVIDGRDISPLLLGTSKTSPREAHYYFSGYNLQAVRQGPWKLAIAPQPEGMGKTGPREGADGKPRLYNLDAEIGELTSVAEQHSDIVAKLQALATRMDAEIGGSQPKARRPAGEVAQPKTLYPTDEAASRNKANAAAAKPADLEKLQPGDVVEEASAPQVGNRPFTIRCAVNTGQKDAIILAHGGLSVGYALYLRDGRVVFAVRTGRSDVTELTAAQSANGPLKLEAALKKDGRMTLNVNEAPPVSAEAGGLLAHQPAENFCLGLDDAQPVSPNSPRQKFAGTIKDLTIRPE
jgi:arylsulfatase A-like enzyme